MSEEQYLRYGAKATSQGRTMSAWIRGILDATLDGGKMAVESAHYDELEKLGWIDKLVDSLAVEWEIPRAEAITRIERFLRDGT